MVRLTDRFIFFPMSLEVLGLAWTVERVRILSVDRTFSSAAALACWAFFSSLRKTADTVNRTHLVSQSSNNLLTCCVYQ